MNNSDLINILNSHREKTEITLQRAKDCKDFWRQFVDSVYMAIPARDDDNRIDLKVREALFNFESVDSLEVVNKKGKLLKRFGHFWKDETGTKLPDGIMGIIGDILQRHLTQSGNTYFVDFTDVIDWRDGMFGKSDSCWWGCHSDSQDVFIDNGGWGIRFYEDMDDNQGIGRTWILPRNGMLLGFNSYGVSRPQTSKVIKAIFEQSGIKLHYKQCSIENSQNHEIPYVNGDSGFVLYPDGMENIPDDFDLDMETDDSDKVHCCHCGDSIDPDSGEYEYINDEYYCYECACREFSSCDKCNEWCDQSDVHDVENHKYYYRLCEHCAKSEDYIECYECNKWVQDYDLDSDGDAFCLECAEAHLTHCDECDENFYHEHECPLHNDYDGLEEIQEESFHAQLFKNGDKVENHQNVTVYRIAGHGGIALYNPHSIDSKYSDEWNISHDLSGLAIKSGLSFKSAKELFIAIAPLTDWNRPKDELRNTDGLFPQVTALIREITG